MRPCDIKAVCEHGVIFHSRSHLRGSSSETRMIRSSTAKPSMLCRCFVLHTARCYNHLPPFFPSLRPSAPILPYHSQWHGPPSISVHGQLSSFSVHIACFNSAATRSSKSWPPFAACKPGSRVISKLAILSSSICAGFAITPSCVCCPEMS